MIDTRREKANLVERPPRWLADSAHKNASPSCRETGAGCGWGGTRKSYCRPRADPEIAETGIQKFRRSCYFPKRRINNPSAIHARDTSSFRSQWFAVGVVREVKHRLRIVIEIGVIVEQTGRERELPCGTGSVSSNCHGPIRSARVDHARS